MGPGQTPGRWMGPGRRWTLAEEPGRPFGWAPGQPFGLGQGWVLAQEQRWGLSLERLQPGATGRCHRAGFEGTVRGPRPQGVPGLSWGKAQPRPLHRQDQ
jgi:hypothetical protein